VIPVFCRPYSLPYALQNILSNKLNVDGWDREGKIVEIYHSEWASPVFLVPKSDGDYRLFVDFKNTFDRCLKTNVGRHLLDLEWRIVLLCN